MKKRLLVIALALVLGISSVNRVFAASGVIIVPNMQIHLCGIYDEDGRDRTSWMNNGGDYLSWIPDANVVKHTVFNISCIDWSDVYAKMSQSVAEMTNGSYEIVDERLVWDSNVLSMRFSVEIEIDGYLVVETINIPVR